MTQNTTQRKEVILKGTQIAPGLAMGQASIYSDILHQNYSDYDIGEEQIQEEHQRIEQAFEEVREDLRHSVGRVEQELNAELAQIFRAQEMLLSDPELVKEIGQELERELTNAEETIQRVLHRWEKKFRNMEDTVLKQRADDIADLSRRLLRSLRGIHAHELEDLPPNTVLVANHLLPSDTVFLSRESTVGVVVECGGTGSHAALLTRALGIPAVGQIPGVLDKIEPGEQVLLNGNSQTVICSPADETVEAFEQQVEQYHAQLLSAQKHSHERAVTQDGVPVTVMANITCREDVEQAVQYGADGIGLYRVESFYLAQKMLPVKNEVLEEMKHTLNPVRHLPVTVRLLDMGGDKHPPTLTLPKEGNPFLGSRGIRLLAEYPELFATQIRAMLELSQDFDVYVLIPMVTVAEDMQLVQNKFRTIAEEMGIGSIPPVGAMIETPAAALCADQVAKYSNFLSIGTNDLTQYTMAASRENVHVNQYFQENHQAIFRLLRVLFQQLGQSATPVSLCGELAGDRGAIAQLLEIGIRSLSVAPPLVPIIKETVRGINLKEC